MRIVIKPGGLMLIGVAFTLLTYVLFTHGVHSNAAMASSVATAKPTAGYTFGQKTIITAPEPNAPEEILQNGNFEDEFVASIPDSNPPVGRVSGSNGIKWYDNSTWGQANVTYQLDTAMPHSGKKCQQMILIDKKGIGQGQFAQIVTVPGGKKLQASVWLRAEKPVDVTFVLRDPAKPEISYAYQDVTLSTQWQKLNIDWVSDQKRNLLFMVILKAPGTIWIDDASLQVAP